VLSENFYDDIALISLELNFWVTTTNHIFLMTPITFPRIEMLLMLLSFDAAMVDNSTFLQG
jgi:hypothetical protein